MKMSHKGSLQMGQGKGGLWVCSQGCSPQKVKIEADWEWAGCADGKAGCEKSWAKKKKKDCLQSLNDDLSAMIKKKNELEDNIELCSQKLIKAEKWIGGLGGRRIGGQRLQGN